MEKSQTFRIWNLVVALVLVWSNAGRVSGQSAGTLDAAFADPKLAGGSVLVPQPDGKMLVTGGGVVTLAPIAFKNALRLNEDGTVDASFSVPGTGINGLALLPDGRSLVYGAFTTLGVSTNRNLAILKADGSPDSSFVTGPTATGNLPLTLALLRDGSGAYVGYAGGVLSRLNLDGSTHAAFVPTGLDGGNILGLAVSSSGHVLVAQSGRIFRLQADGARDASYTETSFPTASPRFALGADDSLFVGGATALVNGTEFRTLFKLKPNGGLDPAFKFSADGKAGGDKSLTRVMLQPDHKLLISIAGVNLSRVLPDGTPDNEFTTPATATVFALDSQGRIVVNGTYLQTSPTVLVRSGIFRLLNNAVPQKPSVTSQPASQVVFAGENAEFGVAASGTPPLSYQWQFKGRNLVGAVTNRLVLAEVTSVNAGEYLVLVTNSQGSVASSNAVLTVNSQPRIQTQPVSFTSYSGEATNLSVSVLGEPPFAFQWFHHFAPVPNATSMTLEFPSLRSEDAGHYTLVAANAFGSVTSTVAQVTVLAALPQWTVLTNPATGGSFTNLANPFRPETALKVVSDGRRGAVLLYSRGVERWNDAGERLWSTRYVEPDFGQLGAMALDRDGNTYVHGMIHFDATFGELAMSNRSAVIGPNGHQQAFIAKLDPDGHALWYRLFEAAGPTIWDLAVAADDSVIFVGRNGGKQGRSYLGTLSIVEDDYAAAIIGKLSPTGTPQWLKSYPQFTFNRSTCEADSVVADNSGIYLRGLISSSIQFGPLQLQNPGVPIHWLGKLNTNGEPVWIKATGGTAAQHDPLALRGGQLWFLLGQDGVLQHWSTDGVLLGSVAVAPGIRQLGLTASGEPILLGYALGPLAIGGTPLSAGSQRPFVWYARWGVTGIPFNTRVITTTTNAVPGNGFNGVQLASFDVNEGGDVYLAGGFNTAMRFMGQVFTVPNRGYAGDFNQSGAYLAKLSAASLLPVPQFTQQPIASYSLQTGDSVRIGVKATGPLPIAYQWRRNGVPVSGATNDFYEFSGAVVSDGGVWDCLASNSFGATASELSQISVAPPFTIRTQPLDRLVLLGGEISSQGVDSLALSPNSLADKLLSFFITNTTSARFPLGGRFKLQFALGSYEIPAAGDLGLHQGSWQSFNFGPEFADIQLRPWTFDQGRPNAALGLLLGGRFNLHLDITAADGCCAAGTFAMSGGTNSASFLVNTSILVPDGNYQWQKDQVDLPGQTTSRLTLAGVTAADAGFYRCIITYRGYSETSRPAELRLATAGSATLPPVLTFEPFTVGTAGLTLPAWPPGFVLQRTASLSSGDWQIYRVKPPVTIPLTASGEFFRLAPAP